MNINILEMLQINNYSYNCTLIYIQIKNEDLQH